MKRVKVGLVGAGQLSFPGDKQAQFSRSSSEMRELSESIGFDLFVYDQIVITEEDGERAVRACEAENVDFLMLQCVSYSSGFLAPVFGRAQVMGLGLWAIPEGVDEGVVPFNSFCGINMFAGIIGHYLSEYNVHFKWFYGNKGNRYFDSRLKVTMNAMRSIKNMKSSKIALIGGIAPGFNDLLFDERKILKMYDGIKINRLHEFSEIKDRAAAFKEAEIRLIAESMSACACRVNPKASPLLGINARFYKAYKDFIAEYGYDAVAVSCWPEFQDQYDFSICSVLAQLNEEGTVAACEGDLVSALDMLNLKYLSNDAVTLMDLIAFDDQDQTALLWHCGPTAKQFCNGDGYALDLNYSGAPHEFGMENPSGCGITRDMVFKGGAVTVARLDAALDNMLLLSGDFIDYDKKSLCGSRGWLGNIKLNMEDISVCDLVNTVMVNRFPHHFPVAQGDYTNEIAEMCSWLDIGSVPKIPYREFMQNKN